MLINLRRDPRVVDMLARIKRTGSKQPEGLLITEIKEFLRMETAIMEFLDDHKQRLCQCLETYGSAFYTGCLGEQQLRLNELRSTQQLQRLQDFWEWCYSTQRPRPFIFLADEGMLTAIRQELKFGYFEMVEDNRMI